MMNVHKFHDTTARNRGQGCVLHAKTAHVSLIDLQRRAAALWAVLTLAGAPVLHTVTALNLATLLAATHALRPASPSCSTVSGEGGTFDFLHVGSNGQRMKA